MKHYNLRTAAALALCLLLAFSSAGCTILEKVSSLLEEAASETDTPTETSSITAHEATGEFSMSTADGAFTRDGTTYTVTAAGTYVLQGKLDGQIIVSAGEDDEVVLELTGVTVTNSTDSPIKLLSASKVEISAIKDTENIINDTRETKVSDDDAQGGGAIWADVDLKLKGSGTLVINASYNNGVHTTKDLTIQKLTLQVTAVNNAIKGNDSIKLKSGTIVAISTNGDGVKTSSTDVNKSGELRGDITLLGGSLTVYAAGDGIQAAHDFIMAADEEAKTTPTVTICTGSYSSYTADSATTTSYKGVKADNEVNISAGSIEIQSYDDGLHANSGTVFDGGGTGSGAISISGGTVTMTVYSPEGATGSGKTGPGGRGGSGGGSWGGQQTVSGADGIHADGVLTISGGSISIDSAYEGLEANVVNITGGSTVVTAVDDGVNATKGASSAQVNISGGFLDVSVAPNGDYDGIDSNGTYTQTGGVVITRGPNSEMAAALDADGTVSVTGGTLVILGYGRVQKGSGVSSYSLSLHSAGSHSIKVNGTTYSFTNGSSYGQTICVSDSEVTGS